MLIKVNKYFLLYFILLLMNQQGFSQLIDKNDKLKVCFVEGRGTYKKASKFCPIIEKQSMIECVIGYDRLDCLRRIQKGTAHFGVFSSEDLVIGRWANAEILLTNEMRFNNQPFEYDIVAIVDNSAGIHSVQDLKGSRFCHPGYGLNSNHMTNILANYFEATLIPRICDDELTIAESRIKASAEFFGPSCKAGPWVPDPIQDRILKKRYWTLCEICNSPATCSEGDKHWGRRGPLYCLTSGTGQVAWARLDDVKSHFGFSGLPAETDPNNFSYLCQDGHLQPMSTRNPCIWLSKPWPAIAASKSVAERVQATLEKITHDDTNSWQSSLLSLLETYHVNITALDMSIPIDNYLDQSAGFQSAYNFPSCNPPRSITYCTTSIIEHYKCSWLQESSKVYGIEPDIQCIRRENLDACMQSTQNGQTDVVRIDQRDRVRAERDYQLKPIIYEYSKDMTNKYVTLAVVRDNSKLNINNFADLKGKRACFPHYEDAAYLSVLETLWNQNLTQSHCPFNMDINSYFASDSCTWEPSTVMNNQQQQSRQSCDGDQYRGDEGALRCLIEGKGDVAFLNLNVFQNFTDNIANMPWALPYRPIKLKLLCPHGRSPRSNELCYINWTPTGHIMISNKTKVDRSNEIYNTLRDMDKLFGKKYSSSTLQFGLFGPFDRQHNIMFKDSTDNLYGIIDMFRDRTEHLLEKTYTQYAAQKCIRNHSNRLVYQSNLISFSILISLSTTITVLYFNFKCTFR